MRLGKVQNAQADVFLAAVSGGLRDAIPTTSRSTSRDHAV